MIYIGFKLHCAAFSNFSRKVAFFWNSFLASIDFFLILVGGRRGIGAPWTQEAKENQSRLRFRRGGRRFVFTLWLVSSPSLEVVVVVIFTDDEDKIREELKDLIDDRPIDDESDGDSDGSGPNAKRKKSDDDDDELDDRLEDEDYELIEENLGVKVERVTLIGLDT